MSTARWLASLLASFLLIASTGCSSGGDPAQPPPGWTATETHWWQTGVDTAGAFRNMENLNQMGVTEEQELATARTGVTQEQFNDAIKRSLIRLYRNDPQTIDSLFEQYAVPELQDADLSGDIVGEQGQLDAELTNEYKQAAYKAINNHYREPRRTESEGESAVVYPDSLRRPETSGEVELQVRLDENGEPVAIGLVQGVHPTLNAIAMKAAVQRTWEPAYVKRGNEWVPEPSWVRFSINFRPPPSG